MNNENTKPITADELTVGYKKPLISDICFEVRGGSIMTLIGPNGAGKSTILKTLAGELEALGGRVCICGTEFADIKPRERAKKLSVLLTERMSAELMTCREVIETGRYPYTGYFGRLSDTDAAAVDEAVSLTGCGEFADREFMRVSDGQRQRVLLAMAICREPDVLILDEPTSYLDIHHKIVFLEILRNLAQERGMAVVMSVHELELAEKISDHVLCVKDGRVFASGKPQDIFTRENVQKLFDIDESMYTLYFG